MDLYCEKKYGVYLELPQFANGRAEQITAYIRTALMQAGSVEIWDVWLSGYWLGGHSIIVRFYLTEEQLIIVCDMAGDSVCRKAEDYYRFCHPKKTYGYEFEV